MHHFTILRFADSSGIATVGRHLVAIRNSVPFGRFVAADRIYADATGHVVAYWATNEPGVAPPEVANGLVRFIYGDGPPETDKTELLPTAELHRKLNLMPGRFSAAVVDLIRGDIAAGTTLARIEPLHWYEDDELLIVGTWAETIAQCLDVVGHRRHSTGELFSFLNAGHFCDDNTFCRDVRLIPAYATLHHAQGRTTIKEEFHEFITQEVEPSPSFYDDVCHAFVKACKRCAGTEDVEISLSGGKDSRLLLSGLLHSQLNVKATTISGGASNYSDVYCAKLVAESAKIGHVVKLLEGKDSSSAVVNLYRRASDVLKATDNGIISYANISYNQRHSGRVMYNGMVAEYLRGSTGKQATAAVHEMTKLDYLLKRWGRQNRFFKPEIFESYLQWLHGWLGAFPREISEDECAEYSYVYVRMGRWASAQSRAASMSRRPSFPHLDNRFVTTCLTAPTALRVDDRLVYEMMRRLAPELAALPFANDHWRCEDKQNHDGMRQQYPDAFIPSKKTDKCQNLDWRVRWVEHLTPELDRVIFNSSGSEHLFQVVDREKLRKLFDTGAINNGHRFMLFALYAAAIYYSRNRDADGEDREVEIML